MKNKPVRADFTSGPPCFVQAKLKKKANFKVSLEATTYPISAINKNLTVVFYRDVVPTVTQWQMNERQ